MKNTNLEILKFNKLTPIQEEVLKNFQNKKHLVGVAPTGTGKTHAYLMPIKDNIINGNNLEAVILVPTNELIQQVKKMAKDLFSEYKIKAYDSSIDKKKEFSWLLKNQPNLVITTPDKLKLFSDNGLKVNTVKYLVFDEADMMFDESFLETIDILIGRMEKAKYLLFSATISEFMHNFIKKYFGVYDLIDTNNKHKLKIEHKIIKVMPNERTEMLAKVIARINPFLALIFVSKKEDQEKVFAKLHDDNLNVTLLSSAQKKHERKNIMNDIINLKYQYVVASDLAARGLDFDVSHVINYDLPYHLEFFKHRSGRTGRMEKSGEVITLVSNDDRNKVKRLIEMGFDLKEYRVAKDTISLVSKTSSNPLTKDEKEAISKIPKPRKVKPNYKKKNSEKVKKAKKSVRRIYHVKNR